MEGKHATAAASLSSPSRRTHHGRPTRFRLLERMCKQRLHNHGVRCRSKGRSEQIALAAVGELEVDVLAILPLKPSIKSFASTWSAHPEQIALAAAGELEVDVLVLLDRPLDADLVRACTRLHSSAS